MLDLRRRKLLLVHGGRCGLTRVSNGRIVGLPYKFQSRARNASAVLTGLATSGRRVGRGNAETVKIGCQPAPKRVPAVPRNLLRFECGPNRFTRKQVEIQRVSPEILKNKSCAGFPNKARCLSR
jgi:hypothetical protein